MSKTVKTIATIRSITFDQNNATASLVLPINSAAYSIADMIGADVRVTLTVISNIDEDEIREVD